MDINKAALASVVNIIIHDLVNPLSFARGGNIYAKSLVSKGDADKKDILDGLDASLEGIDLAVGMLKELEAIGKGDKLVKDDVDLEKLFSRLRHFSGSGVGTFNSEIVGNGTVKSSFYALYILAQNLVKNAYEHSSGCHVDVTYSDGLICIKDNGKGIEEDKLDLIFSNYSSKASDGGLGLQIVTDLAKRLDIKLSVESEVGKGTAFKLRFA